MRPHGARVSLHPTMNTHRETSGFRRLDVSVGLGLLVGSLYSGIDIYFDHVVGAELRPSASPCALFHGIVDLVLPILAGALLGMVLYFMGERARMAAFEKRRADELAGRINKIERDQAVWVISASLLHELKTPLHSLGLLLDEITELPEGATEDRKEFLANARAQCERLEARLLALRSLENTPPPPLPQLDLSVTIRGLLEPLSRLAGRQGVELMLSGSTQPAYAHPSYLRIIIENLVENSLDALRSSSSGRIVLQLSDEGHWAKVAISDNGPGLDEDSAARLFDPLYSQKTSGLGLGLSIARSLCRSLGGDLSLVGSETGAKFEFCLRGAMQ